MLIFIKNAMSLFLICLLLTSGLNFAMAKTKVLRVSLQPKSESQIKGHLDLSDTAKGLHVQGTLSGFEPNSKHGFHIHEKADCSDPKAKSAGGHYAPQNNPHGAPHSEQTHAGDLGNIQANKDGVVTVDKVFENLTLYKSKSTTNKHPVMNKAFVVHQSADDFKSQPSGAAGARIACGEIIAHRE